MKRFIQAANRLQCTLFPDDFIADDNPVRVIHVPLMNWTLLHSGSQSQIANAPQRRRVFLRPPPGADVVDSELRRRASLTRRTQS